MRTTLAVGVLFCAMSSFSAEAAEAKPSRGVLGLRLEMPRAEAEKRLKKLGELEKTERRGQEIWKVKDKTFSHLIVAFSKEGEMRFITAVAREEKGAKRLAYASVGDLGQARQSGDEAIKNFNYEWDLPKAGESPATTVSARGRDAKFLKTLSLKRVGSD